MPTTALRRTSSESGVVERRYLPGTVPLHEHADAALLVRWKALSGRTDETAELIGNVRESHVGAKEPDGRIDLS